MTSTELGYVSGVTGAIQTQMNGKAPLASPDLTGVPTAPTASSGVNNTQIATTAFVKSLGYITGYTETDPTIFAWAKAATKPSYTFTEIGSKPTTLAGYGITDGQLLIATGTTAQYYRGDKTWQTLNTAGVPELTNLYWTSARFDTAFSGKTTSNLAE